MNSFSLIVALAIFCLYVTGTCDAKPAGMANPLAGAMDIVGKAMSTATGALQTGMDAAQSALQQASQLVDTAMETAAGAAQTGISAGMGLAQQGMQAVGSAMPM